MCWERSRQMSVRALPSGCGRTQRSAPRSTGCRRASPRSTTSPHPCRRVRRCGPIERQTLPTAAANVAAESAGSNVFALRRRLNLWRGSTFIAGALAAGLAAIVVLDRTAVAPVVEGGRYVAVVDSDGHEPALIAEVDTVAGIIRVRSLKAETPQGKSLELWHVEEGKQPRSLGILKAGLDAQSIEDTAGAASGLLAVSVEPEGGSPSGAPTGPIVYTGRLIPVE
jgi:anti-sigma-K factor RskA